MKKQYDVTLPIKQGQIQYPGSLPNVIKKVMSTDAGDVVNVTRLNINAHTGTHFDAPHHFVAGGKTIDEMPLAHFMGVAKVLDFTDKAYYIDKPDLHKHKIEKGDIILFKTTNSAKLLQDTFSEEYVYLTAEGAAYLAEKEIATVGVDYLDIDAYDDPDFPCHNILLNSGIVIIEGLNLGAVPAGTYGITALPLKIAGSDGAPGRVVLTAL